MWIPGLVRIYPSLLNDWILTKLLYLDLFHSKSLEIEYLPVFISAISESRVWSEVALRTLVVDVLSVAEKICEILISHSKQANVLLTSQGS